MSLNAVTILSGMSQLDRPLRYFVDEQGWVDYAALQADGSAAGSVLDYVARYLTIGDRTYLDRHRPQPRLRYFKYDWQLNGRT